MEQETKVLIVGAGPAGLATSACLNLQSISNIVLEKEDCCASLWKKRVYDRLKLHLAKQFCELPHMSYSPNAPTFVSKDDFIQYLDDYVLYFDVCPIYHRVVESASFDQSRREWIIIVKNIMLEIIETYVSKFLVVATGENSEGFMPPIPGLDSFKGEIIHSSHYENGRRFDNKNILVVGSGNSGMEIAFDLSNWGAKTCIVVRSPVHILNERIVQLGMILLKHLPLRLVDYIALMLSKLRYGNMLDYGIQRPSNGPFYLKHVFGRSPVIDVGTVDKIRSQEIDVLPAINNVNGNLVHFMNEDKRIFDGIIFATGYRSSVRKWLKEGGGIFNEHGMLKKKSPNHWKGENGIYCVGFASTGLHGISIDAKAVAHHISVILSDNDNK